MEPVNYRFEEASEDDVPEIIDGPMTVEELEWIRTMKGQPDWLPEYMPPEQKNWNDDDAIMLSPLMKANRPLRTSEILAIMADHPVVVCKTELANDPKTYFFEALERYARYCFDRFTAHAEETWLIRGLELCEEFDMDPPASFKHTAEVRKQISEAIAA